MKNLKKTLCLVLVIAMVCSLFVSVNAAAFKDQADIDNATAAAVLNEIGVITGYTDGSFKPAGVLTRAEGATIIARLLLGDDAASYTAAGNPFDDVKATDWHAGYIAYCVAEGIAAGYGNGKFGPNDTLTVAQFGKMLLNALGYESAREGFTGADWATPVGKYINKLGLAEGTNATLNASCTRQVAAQLALNTLKSTMVEYEQASTTIKGGDLEIVVGGSAAKKVEWTTANASKDGKILAADGYVQFAEQYFPLLKLDESDNNNFGRPSVNAWTIRGEELGTEDSNVELLKTYTGTVTKGALYDLVGKKIVKELTDTPANLTVYVDGDPVAFTSVDLLFNDENAYKGDSVQLTSSVYPTGNGVVTEVYLEETETANLVTIVIVNTYIAKAVADYDEDLETLTVEVFGATDLGVTGTITLSAEEYEVAGYEEDDYLLVTIDGNDDDTSDDKGTVTVATIAPAKTVSGTIDTFTGGAEWLRSITVGGKKYSYSKKVINSRNGDPTLVNSAMKDTAVTLVLDAAGYVISFAKAEMASNYVYVAEVQEESGFAAKKTYAAAVYFTDGTYEEISVDKIYTTQKDQNGKPVELDVYETATGWYTYTITSEGKYTLSDISAENGQATVSGGNEVKGESVVFYGNAKANGKTVFIVVDEEGESTVFTGYKTMPTVSAKNNVGTLVVDVLNDTETGFASFVYVQVKGGEISFTGSTKDTSTIVYVYRADTYSASVDGDGNEFNTNSYVLVNGVKSKIETVAEYTPGAGLYINVQYDNVTGYIKDMEAVSGYNADAMTNGKANDAIYLTYTKNDEFIYEGDVLAIGKKDGAADEYKYYTLAEECDVVFVDGKTYSKTSAGTLVAKSGKIAGAVYGIVNADGALTSLYVFNGTL